MSDIGDAIGTAAEGALLSAAVEGEVGKPLVKGHFAEGACLNCGTELIGNHCHACGQKAHLHRTIGAFMHDLLHGVLHFDSKTWRTVRDLVWRPGKMTRDYIDGRRQTYVSPIALFLFVVFLSFATFQLLGGADALTPEFDTDGLEAVEDEYEAASERLAKLQGDLVEAQEAGDAERVASLQSSIEDVETERAALAGAMQVMGAEDLPAGVEAQDVTVGIAKSSTWQQAKKNPQLLAYKMQTNAYKFAWLLIPISVPFVWLLFFWKRRFKLYDHTVFTTYSISFMLALAGLSGTFIYLGTFLKYDGLQVIGLLALLYAPVHMYKHVRGTYQSSRAGAFLRMIALSLFAWIAVGVFAATLASMA